MRKIIKNIFFVMTIAVVFFTTGCDSVPDEITELNFNRLFSPLDLETSVVNKTQVKLVWKEVSGAESYTIEIFADDSLTFTGTPAMTIEGVTNNQIPYTITSGLIGQTQYSVRIKAVGTSISESKWVSGYFETDSEQILAALSEADIDATEVTLHWTAGEIASEIVLTSGDNEVRHVVTTEEINAGSATISGLLEDASYTAKLMKDLKIRGSAKFTTLIDLSATGTIVVNPGDDLQAVIQGAPTNSRIVIVATGSNDEFLTGGVTIDLDKNIIIRAYSKNNKPIIHAQFRGIAASASLTIKDVILDGSGTPSNRDHVLQFTTTGIELGNYVFKDCVIKNYNKSLVAAASGIVVSVPSILIENCKVSNILTNSADFIDVRSGLLQSVTLKNSTFANCAPARDFFRLDDSYANFSGKLTEITVDRCSFSGVCNDATRRILYVRFGLADYTSTTAKHTIIKFTNNVVANSLGYYVNNAANDMTFTKNNYFNAANYFLAYTGTILNVVTDMSGTQLALEPGFVDAANGDLTITNQTLLGQGVGASISW